MSIKNILLDRDGTLIEDKHYLSDPNQVCLLPEVGSTLATLAQSHRFFLVSNQSGIGRGYFTEQDVRLCQSRLDKLLLFYGVTLQDKIWCPHAPEDNCPCRKPAPGMWQTLATKHNLLASETMMVGDKLDDIYFAQQAGLKPILVLTGKGLISLKKLNITSDTLTDPISYLPNLTIISNFSQLLNLL